jgi:hypothetical protein
MPDLSGLLTPADNEKIQKWWTERWKAPVFCPVCKTTEWSIAPHVVSIPRHAVDAAMANTQSYPHIVVTCRNCAHSMFFNAAQMGVVAVYINAKNDSLAVNDEVLLSVFQRGLRNPGEALAPVITALGDQPDPIAVALYTQAVAVELDFMKPIWTARDLGSGGGDAEVVHDAKIGNSELVCEGIWRPRHC